jgi:hypothetical protein
MVRSPPRGEEWVEIYLLEIFSMSDQEREVRHQEVVFTKPSLLSCCCDGKKAAERRREELMESNLIVIISTTDQERKVRHQEVAV